MAFFFCDVCFGMILCWFLSLSSFIDIYVQFHQPSIVRTLEKYQIDADPVSGTLCIFHELLCPNWYSRIVCVRNRVATFELNEICYGNVWRRSEIVV